MNPRITAWAMAVLLFLAFENAWGAVQYAVTDLGRLPNGASTTPLAVNASGQVVGMAGVGTGTARAFLYSNGTMTDLGTLGGSYSRANAINDSGQVAGTATTPAGPDHAFLYSNGMMTDIPMPPSPEEQFSYGYGINSSGVVVGTMEFQRVCMHAFLYSGGKLIDLVALGALPGTGPNTSSIAYDINDSGDIVGWYNDGRAFLYSGGKLTDLGVGQAYAINASGQVVGSRGHAFLYSGGATMDLGALPGDSVSYAYDINASGQVVGTSYAIPEVDHPFLYENGVMTNLNDLLDPVSGAGWTLYTATGINDRGQIVGSGANQFGDRRGFLLTPIPEPSALCLLAIGAIAAFCYLFRFSPARWKTARPGPSPSRSAATELKQGRS